MIGRWRRRRYLRVLAEQAVTGPGWRVVWPPEIVQPGDMHGRTWVKVTARDRHGNPAATCHLTGRTKVWGESPVCTTGQWREKARAELADLVMAAAFRPEAAEELAARAAASLATPLSVDDLYRLRDTYGITPPPDGEAPPC